MLTDTEIREMLARAKEVERDALRDSLRWVLETLVYVPVPGGWVNVRASAVQAGRYACPSCRRVGGHWGSCFYARALKLLEEVQEHR